MILKRCLSIVLATSMVVPAALSSTAMAQTIPGYSTDANDDPIQLILQAMHAATPEQARAFLAKAKQRVEAEKLPPENQYAIDELLNKAASRIGSQQKLSPFDLKVGAVATLTDAMAAQSPATPNANGQASLLKLLQQNPDLRDSMREIGLGRVSRDAIDLPAIIHATQSKSLDAIDAAQAKTVADQFDPDALVGALRAAHLIKDYSTENNALRARYESVPVEVLARQIIKEAAEYSVGVGALKGIINSLSASRLSTSRHLAGLTVDTLGTLVVNANLILRLADLYGVNTSSSQNQDVMIMSALAAAKLTVYYAHHLATVRQTAERMGELFSEAAHAKSPGAMGLFVAKVLGAPLIAGLLSRIPLAASLETKAAPAAAAVASAVAQPVSPAGEAPKTPVASQRLLGKARVLNVLFSMAQSGAETYGVGLASMWFLARARNHDRQMMNANFQSFLNQRQGEGFLKLLILAMNTGEKHTNVISIKETKDPKANFILNLARSMKICSPADRDRFRVLSQRAAKGDGFSMKNLADRDYKIMRYACDNSLGDGSYANMAKEFMTFDAISPALVTSLRLTGEDNRRQMGEVLLQLLFLGGEPDQKQMDFFNTTVAKILAFDRLKDSNYFDRLYAFIRVQGGMKENLASPTGYGIGASVVANPYDLSVGYTAAGGPDSPRPATTSDSATAFIAK